MALTIIFFAIVAAIIFIGIKRNVNFGLLGIIAALGIAILVKGESATQVITESFPLTLFFNLFITTLFYGFANASGAMHGVAQRIAYKFRNHSALLPFVGYVLTIVVSAMGPGAMSTPIIVSALVFSLAMQADIIRSLLPWRYGREPWLARRCRGCLTGRTVSAHIRLCLGMNICLRSSTRYFC